jgi:hypothetical protein
MIDSRSPLIDDPDYWWYHARAELLETVLTKHTANG